MDEEPPTFVPLRSSVQQFMSGQLDSESFLFACGTLSRLLESTAGDPKLKINIGKSKVGQRLVAIPGMEDVLSNLGWGPAAEGASDELVFLGSADQLPASVEGIQKVAAWARRMAAGVRRVPAISDPQGWSSEFHNPVVLQDAKSAKFKGAVWDVSFRPTAPDGVILWHNSPFSNWSVCGQRVRMLYQGEEFSFPTSEHLVMVFKEHLLVDTPLKTVLRSQMDIGSASESKALAGRKTRNAKDYNWWRRHESHLVVGATACFLKFSQDAGLRQLLTSTQNAILVETAPHDGAWGVAMDSSTFLKSANADHFNLDSTCQETLTFEVNGRRFTRECRHANALGKSLMIAREMLIKCDDVSPAPVVELRDTVNAVLKYLKDKQKISCNYDLDFESVEERLSSAF